MGSVSLCRPRPSKRLRMRSSSPLNRAAGLLPNSATTYPGQRDGHCRLPSGRHGSSSQSARPGASRPASLELQRAARDTLQASPTGPQHLRPKLANYRRAKSAGRQANQCRNNATRRPWPAHQALWLKKGSSAALFFNISTRNNTSPMARGPCFRRADCGGTTPTRTQQDRACAIRSSFAIGSQPAPGSST
jgi:hypothetical protein